MISRLRGRIEEILDNSIIVDVGALGIEVSVPAAHLPTYRIDQAVFLYTHFHVREQELALFGFATDEELRLFELLIGVSGVGPRLALNIISTLPPDSIRLAVANDEPGLLTRVPGIGKKSAQKILFHLKDKFTPSEIDMWGAAGISDADTEVIDALTSLGYSVVEAQRAMQGLPKDIEGVEERLRAALSQLSP
ncbi:MAG: Holliday junction branch migration protein RuvA [Chloroflexi bacterium]|nr:Holliday junction branch migration protein RuvA [Chloroflexota bacterium]